MSKVTIDICDIKGCRSEAPEYLDIMLLKAQENGDGSFKIYIEENVDLCGTHHYEYKLAIPDMKIERKAK